MGGFLHIAHTHPLGGVDVGMTFDLLCDLHLSAKIDQFFFNIADIWQTVLDSYTITIKKMCCFRWGHALKNFNLIKFKIADCQP